MADLQPVSPGEALAVRADDWNVLLAAGKDYQSRRAGRQGSALDSDPLTPACLVLVRNDTGADLAERSVLKVTGVVLDPSSAAVNPLEVGRRPALTAATPGATTDAVVILLEPVAAGSLGLAAVAGVCVCKVLVNSSSHAYAQPIAGDHTRLGSATLGPAEILWKSGASGERWALVRLDRNDTSAMSSAVGLADQTHAGIVDANGHAQHLNVNLVNDGAAELKQTLLVGSGGVFGLGSYFTVQLPLGGALTAYNALRVMLGGLSGAGRSTVEVGDAAGGATIDLNVNGALTVGGAFGGVGFFGAAARGQQTGGAATAGGTYTATEQTMLQKVYDALRAFGLLS